MLARSIRYTAKEDNVVNQKYFNRASASTWPLPVVLEGIISGCNFLVLFQVLEMIFGKTINYKDILRTTAILGIIFAIRLVLYAVSYMQAKSEELL